jgi:hypothetical protein
MPTLTLEEQLMSTEHNAEPTTLDYSQVRRVLLRDGIWHSVYSIDIEKEQMELEKTLAHIRRKFDQLCRSKSDAEVIAAFPTYIPYRQHPAMRPQPLEQITIHGQPWLRWNESREKESGALILSEVITPMSEVAALDFEKSASAEREKGV